MAENSFNPNDLPDEEVSKNASANEGTGFNAPGDFGDMPVSPLDKKGGDQKSRMGYNSDALGNAGKVASAAGGEGSANDKAQEAARGAIKSAAAGGEGGGLPGGKGLPGGSGPLTQGDKEAEAKKGNTEKNVDTAAEAAASYFATPVAGAAIEKAGGVRGILKKGGILVLALLAPLIFIGFFIAYVLNGGAWDAIAHVLTDKKTREFGLELADNWSQNNGMLNNAVKAAKAANAVTYHGPNTAIAAPASSAIEPGSFADKLTKIDWSKSQFQTLPKNDCRYDLELEEVVYPDGRKSSIPKSFIDKQTGKSTPIDQINGNTTAGYCIQQKYPIYNLLWRQPLARDINKKANLYLNYAAPKDSAEVQGSSSEVDKYVYDKTISRVTSETSSGPDLNTFKPIIDALEKDYAFNVGEYNKAHPEKPIPFSESKRDIPGGIKKMYDDMAKGTSPYDLNVADYFNIPIFESGPPTETNLIASGISQTICPFVYTFMDTTNPDNPITAKNVRASIESRLTGSERGTAKNLTLTDTRRADQLSSSESNASIQQNDNWASSTAYQIDVYNQLRGVQMNPEGTNTRAYNAPQSLIYSPELIAISNNCQKLAILNSIPNNQKTKEVLNEGFQLNIAMIEAYKKLKLSIKDESPGVFESTSDFGLEQIITGYVRTGSITAVSGLEPGPDNFNRQSMGLRQLMNDYTLGIGGRFLTNEESQDLAIRTDGLDRQQQKENGIAYRLFNTGNIHSMASIVLHNTTTPNTAKSAMLSNFKSLLNPLWSLADIHSSLTFYATGNKNTAFAADITGDKYFKIDTAGFTPAELALDPVENANIIEKIKKDTTPQTEAQRRKFAHYDECFKAKIPTSQYFETQIIPKDNGYKLFFTYYPEKFQLLDANKQPVDNNPDSEFNKYSDCKFLLQDAKNINDPNQILAIRYRLYNYYNTQVDYLIKLSSDESDTSIYANNSTSSAGNGGGSANCQSAQGLEKIPCEGQKYVALDYDNAHRNVRAEGVKTYRDRCTDDKLGSPSASCNIDCSSFVAVMLYDAFGIAPDFPTNLRLFVGGTSGTESGKIYTVNDEALSASLFKEINIDTETRPGDIVTMRDHMGVVKAYDTTTKKATTIESTGQDGPVEYQWNNIHEEGFNRAFRYIGPGAPQ
jgi:hypothetical protein